MDAGKLVGIGKTIRSQIRVSYDGDYALYTISEVRNEALLNVVRMCDVGKDRLDAAAPFFGSLSTVCVKDLTESEAIAQSECIEKLIDDNHRKSLIVVAPHGGNIELKTSAQADRITSQLDVSSWQTKGYKSGGGAYTRWHITSIDISAYSFPKLKTVLDRGFDYCISLHGFSQDTIIIGGKNDEALKIAVRDAIQTAVGGAYTVEIQDQGPYDGNDTENIINKLAAVSIQVEQPYSARQDYWEQIADAISGVFAPLI